MFCPAATVLPLPVLSVLGAGKRPRRIRDAVRALLKLAMSDMQAPETAARMDFLVPRWPPYGYSAFAVLDAAGRYPDVWDGARARPTDRQSMVELVAAYIQANFDEHGAVVVHRPSTGFASFPMSRRGRPSALATASACVVLRRLEPIVDDVLDVAPPRVLSGSLR